MERETREKMEVSTSGEQSGEVDKEAGCLSPSTLKLYETQFFGFTPQTCMLRVYSAFQDCLYDILPVVEKVCARQLSKSESAGADELLQSRARECSRKLQQFLEERFKQLSERMEALLVSRCLSVPPNVLLPEDKLHSNHPQDVKVGERESTTSCDVNTNITAVTMRFLLRNASYSHCRLQHLCNTTG